jgi:Protein of unknown function (DUF3168)
MIQELLQGVLGPLVNGASFPNLAAQDAVPPYIVYQRIVSITHNNLQGPSDLQNTRIQIDAYAKTYAQVQLLAAEIRQAMQGAGFINLQISEQDFFETEVRLHRVSLDYSIWSR